MELLLTGKHLEISEEERNLAQKLADKLSADYVKLSTLRMVLGGERGMKTCEALLNGNNVSLNASSKAESTLAAISATYEKLDKAANYIAGGAEYIVTHPDVNCPLADGFMPDVGAFMALIEASTGRKPDLIMGKPYAFTVDYVTNLIGCKKEEIAFVGDRLETDIAIGSKNGLRSVLVFTGVTTKQMYEKSEIKATAAYENIGAFAEDL